MDPAVFYWLDDSCNVMGVIACHVDDFIWGGSEMFSMTVIPSLKLLFRLDVKNTTASTTLEWRFSLWRMKYRCNNGCT